MSATNEPTPDLVQVVVAGNWQVCHDGNTWNQGETAEVPPEVADELERAGYVTRE